MNEVTKKRLEIARQEECWKTVEEFPEYEVSNKGVVRKWYLSYYRYPNPARVPNGSIKVTFIEDGKMNARMLGKVVYETFMGANTTDKDLVYIDGDKTNCKLENLATIDELVQAYNELLSINE